MIINVNSAIISLICLFPITVIIQRYNNILNRFLFTLLVLMLLLSFVLNTLRANTKKKIKAFVMVTLVVVLALYDYNITGESLINFNDVLYLPFWVLFLSYLTTKYDVYKDLLEDKLRLIRFSILFGNLLMLGFVIMERSYFYNGRHRMASGAFLLMLESYYYIKKTKNNRYWICVLWPCVAILNSTSRTYLIMAAAFLLIAYYKQLKNKQWFYLSIVPMALIFIGIVANSDMMQYFMPKQVGVFDFWGSFTSGRTVFWAKDIEAFVNANIVDRVFGQGYNLVYYVNKRAIDAYIYAHNDYLNILIANGIVGLLIYLIALMDFVVQTVKRQKVKFIAILLAVFVFAFNAFFNGEYNYPAATLSIMFLFLILGKEDEFECLE